MDRSSGKALIPIGKLSVDLMRFGELEHQTNGAEIERFLTCIAANNSPQANNGLFLLACALLRYWAGRDDLSSADATTIETSRKICDAMGWKPTTIF